MPREFLRADWRKLIMANYAVDPNVLLRYLPAKTEFDLWNNTCYVSLVGFMFKETRIKGFKIPFHVSFEEVNLRFYVKYRDKDELKRGVVFIKEIVPKPALTFVANTIYKENYETMPMRHSWTEAVDTLNVEYSWKKKKWNNFSVLAAKESSPISEGSEEEFITEHYWGYTKVSDKKTSEYEVAHPKWNVYHTKSYVIDVDFGDVYGDEFSFLNHLHPVSVFLAEGSEISVKHGALI